MNKFKKIILSLALLVILAPVLHAQKLGVGRVMVGGSFLDLSELDQTLGDRGYSAVGNNFLTLGLGFEQFLNKVSLGVDSYNFMIRGDRNFQDYFRPAMNYHYALFKTGFVVYKRDEEMMVYPTLGIGGGRVGIRLVDLDENLIKRESGYGGLMEFALNIRKYQLLEGETRYHMETGFSVGYMRSLGGEWLIQGVTNDSSGLIASPDAIFFRLTLGIAKFRD